MTPAAIALQLAPLIGVTSLEAEASSLNGINLTDGDREAMAIAITQALQEIFSLGPTALSEQRYPTVLRAPAAVTFNATQYSTTISSFATWASWMEGCTVGGGSNDNELVSVSASHELVEMLVDPAINMMTTGPDPKTMYAYESADPVEALSFPVKGIPMSDFVYPSYFEVFRKPKSVQFDKMKKVTKTFQILAGGYQIIFKNGKYSQVFGSKAKAKAFAKEDRRGHRSEVRKKGHMVEADKKKLAKFF